MVTDAGMPGIADPGEYIVKKVAESGLIVEVIPGPSAGITALIGSGLSPKRFVFEGFLPRKGKSRKIRLQEISTDRRTVILFESPHRLQKTLGDLLEYFGPNRRAAIARELTKIHEEYHRGTLVHLLDEFSHVDPKGEIVIVIEGGEQKIESSDDEIRHALKVAIEEGLSTRDAVREVASTLDISKRKVYELNISMMRNKVR
jgi:16S rRNA (cytidine1402-2'-O)-methyltransferase